MWATVVYMIATLIIQLYFRPKQEGPEADTESEYPVAREGNPIPVAFGKPWFKAPNCVWYGNLSSREVKDGDFTAIRYKMGWHMVLCHGPIDSISQIVIGDRLAWSGTQGDGTIWINKKDLFGGDQSEGGVKGHVDIMMGSSTQARNAYLVAAQGANIPAYRGVVSIVPNRFYFGTQSRPKPWKIQGNRVATGPDGGTIWYSTKASISGHLNVVHCIYDAITSTEWGMGYHTTTVDDAAFKAAADTCYTEGFGITLLWDRIMDVKDFIKELEGYIDARVDIDPETGLWDIRLIRDDYTPANLPLFDTTNTLKVVEFGGKGWGETTNELVVKYTDNADGEVKSVTVHDSGNIQIQEGVVSSTKKYLGIPSLDLATRVAMRDLRVAASPLQQGTIVVNRDAYDLQIGDAFRFTDPKYKADELIMRVREIDKGTLENGKIIIDAVQDVFSMPSAGYIAEEASSWTDPINDPTAVTEEIMVEATYWENNHRLSPSELDWNETNVTDMGWAQLVAKPPTEDASGFEHWSKKSTETIYTQQSASVAFCPTAELDGAIVQATDGTYDYKNGQGMDVVEAGSIAIIGDEYLHITDVDEENQTFDADRGILDTAVTAHADGATVWFMGDSYRGIEALPRSSGDVCHNKALTRTGKGTLELASATQINLTLDDRHAKPYPPGFGRVNWVYYPGVITGLATAMWNLRDKSRMLDKFYAINDASIGGDPVGVSYELDIYNENDDLVRTVATSATSYAYPIATELGDTWIPENTYTDLTITNPGAESGDMTGWTTESGSIAAATSYITYIYPRTGSYMFKPDTTADALMVSASEIDLVAGGLSATDIDAGICGVTIEWYQNSFVGLDEGAMGARFYNASSTFISEDQSPYASTAVRVWTKFQVTIPIPANARKMKLLADFNMISTNYGNNTCIDDIRSWLSDTPRLNNKLTFKIRTTDGTLWAWSEPEVTVTRTDTDPP